MLVPTRLVPHQEPPLNSGAFGVSSILNRMVSLNQSVGITAPTDVVFAYVTDPATMAEWIPPIVQTRQIVGSGEGQQFEWTYKLAGLLFRGQSVVVEHVPNAVFVCQSIGGISSTWTFRVGAHHDGAKFAVDIAYDVPVPVLGKLSEHVIASRDGRDLGLALVNVKERLEAGR